MTRKEKIDTVLAVIVVALLVYLVLFKGYS